MDLTNYLYIILDKIHELKVEAEGRDKVITRIQVGSRLKREIEFAARYTFSAPIPYKAELSIEKLYGIEIEETVGIKYPTIFLTIVDKSDET